MEETADTLTSAIFTVAALAFIAFLVWTRRYYAMRRRRDVQETIRAALAQGQNLSPDTVQAISRTADDGRGDLRAGLILMSIGIGLLIFGIGLLAMPVEAGPPDESNYLTAVASAFPILLGAAFLILHYTRPKDLE